MFAVLQYVVNHVVKFMIFSPVATQSALPWNHFVPHSLGARPHVSPRV